MPSCRAPGQLPGHPPAPGLDAVEALAAQVIGLDSELRNEKGRTAQLFQEVDSRLAELQAEARRSANAAGWGGSPPLMPSNEGRDSDGRREALTEGGLLNEGGLPPAGRLGLGPGPGPRLCRPSRRFTLQHDPYNRMY